MALTRVRPVDVDLPQRASPARHRHYWPDDRQRRLGPLLTVLADKLPRDVMALASEDERAVGIEVPLIEADAGLSCGASPLSGAKLCCHLVLIEFGAGRKNAF